MKAMSVHLTFFFEETKVAEEEIRRRLDELLMMEFDGEVEDWSVQWAGGDPPSSEELTTKLDRLDT